MPLSRGKFVIDALALPAYVAGIREKQEGLIDKRIVARKKKGRPSRKAKVVVSPLIVTALECGTAVRDYERSGTKEQRTGRKLAR